tara:strand:- start:555 stop:875 length:321 start_codon:yes stop_codon:yes gene_type:complete
MTKNCPNCHTKTKEAFIHIDGSTTKVRSNHCPPCNYISFDPAVTNTIIQELPKSPLKIKQKIIKLSQDRLGIYLNTHIVESLNLKKGEELLISVPDSNHILIQRKE